MKRRTLLRAAALVTANTVISKVPALSFASPAVHTAKPMRIAVFAPSHCAAPVLYAALKGFYREAGLATEIINYTSQAEIARDLISGVLDCGQLIAPLVFAARMGTAPSLPQAPLVAPMVLGIHGSNLMVRSGVEVTTPRDLKGRTIATHSKFSMHYLLTRLFLERNGLRTASEINVVIAGLKEISGLVQEGKIDAFMMPEPVNTQVERTGTALIYILNKYIWKYHPCCCVTLKKELFEKDRQRVRALVESTARASLHINHEKNRKELVLALRETGYGYADIPLTVLEVALAYQRSDFHPFPFQSSALALLDLMQSYKLIPPGDLRGLARDVFLSDFARECLGRIGARAPKGNFRPETIMGEVRTFEA